ncbi:MAG: translation initiation factor IF-2 [Candidatus Zambryskibacteria bacterium RIFCSPLOWO2_01_FULL_47_14]|uniref:Translation initiation factor IF-2 n=1 Tax=Candidatus Zambryskibacteria bacterium RIFCSPLOWO2_01_FULL_47_14 TaxID=1802763 RepID=A0A1G2U9R9_9BACT|nr:MAG: translation initiation factor IF-2 [Candidatus Zambryskibacteria bacterium RIFCSPLOWO2_01_FULL_47_14]
MTLNNSQSNTFPKPPVVGIFGHIDHGKSTLIDYIRKTNIVEKEAGGITQHVSAYEVTRSDGRKITFLDTPGHEAFKSIRTRGAHVADIAVLIVSAEDGVKPQTLEVLKYILESKLPYLVAITKVDKPAADAMRARQSLAENGVLVEGYGGDVPVAEVSGKTGQGVEEFLDLINLVAELENLRGDPEERGSGVVIETSMDAKRGLAATGIIKNGTVHKGMFAASGSAIMPIRFLLDAEGNMTEELSFSSPVRLIGWDKLPPIGAEFKTFLKKSEAEEYISKQDTRDKKQAVNNTQTTNDTIATLPLIIKADAAGSLEAVEGELAKIARERIIPKIIFQGVGNVNENDIKLAISVPGTTIISFNTKTDAQAAALAERSGISISTFTIIYELTEKVASLLSLAEPKVEVEEISGSAKVLKLFSSAKNKQVLGAKVLSGIIAKGNSVKISRRDAEIGHGKVRELQQAKVNTSKVEEGSEFGALIESKIEIAPGDILEAVSMVTK